MTTYATVTPTLSVGKGYTDVSERHISYYGTLAITTDDYKTGGLTLSFAGVVPQNDPPVRVEVFSETIIDQHFFVYLTGTTSANGLLAILSSNTGAVNAEVTGDATVPTEVSGDAALRFKATFIKGR